MTFPPYGMYVKGFPKVWFESMLQKIDTAIQLYSFIPSGTYNQRSVSSLANETFFGEISDLEPTKLGCPKAVSIPRLISTVTELMHYRTDPSDRAFNMCTTIRPVYPKTPLSEPIANVDDEDVLNAPEETENKVGSDMPRLLVQEKNAIRIRDHNFDLYLRKRKTRKTKPEDISKPRSVSRGCMPVRQHHKCDESKILPTTRLGIDLKDSQT